MFGQLREDHLADLVRQARQPRRGQLLAAELEQQLAVHAYRASDREATGLKAVSST